MTLERPTAPPTPSPAAAAELSFADHYLPVMRLCMRHLRDESDAEDAVQEVFRRAVQQRTALSGDPLPWLITVAKNVCRDELRRRRNGRVALERSAALAPAGEASAPGVDEGPERLVVGRLFVDEMLARLTPAERRVLAARVYHGAAGVDVARVLGTSSSTARVLLARARQKLRRYLEEGQAAFALIPAFGLRALHAMRRHLLERPWTGEASAAMLLPAALLATVMLGPGAAVGGAAAGASAVALGGGAGSVHDARTTVASSPLMMDIAVRHQASAQRGGAGPDPSAPTPSLLPQLTPDVERVAVTDVQPSPNYSSDHTVLMLGGMTPACTPPACSQLYESTDGGATWDYVGGAGLTGSTLILPASSFAQGTFYTWSPLGLQVTTNGGRSFVSAVPSVGGYAVAAPAWSGLGILLSNSALWQLASGSAPKPLSAFYPDESVAGPTLTLPDGHGGYELLQPINSTVSIGGGGSTWLLRCTPVCGSSVQLPFHATPTQLVASPNFTSDRTIFAIGPTAMAVSHDGGQTFGAAIPLSVGQVSAVAWGDSRRLVGTDNGAPYPVIVFSDDDGVTWHRAAIDPSLHFDHPMRVGNLGNGQLIASMEKTNQAGYYGFACSAGGAMWTACTKSGE